MFMSDSKTLGDCEGDVVRLSFTDGEVVRARLVSVDSVDHEDLIYEVVEIVSPTEPPGLHSRPGEYCLALLADLQSWEPEEFGSAADAR